MFVHFNTYDDFHKARISADSSNETYQIGGYGTVIAVIDDSEKPNVLWNDIAYVEDVKATWTHGVFFSGTVQIDYDSSVNLNDSMYKDSIGFNFIYSSNKYTTSNNFPTEVQTGLLQVYTEKTGLIKQIFVDTIGGRIYTRYYLNNVWSEWKDVSATDRIVSSKNSIIILPGTKDSTMTSDAVEIHLAADNTLYTIKYTAQSFIMLSEMCGATITSEKLS